MQVDSSPPARALDERLRRKAGRREVRLAIHSTMLLSEASGEPATRSLVNAMILAAGLGTRLGNLGRSVAKALIDIGGEPLLGRHLRVLEREGVDRVVINTHHLAGQIEAFVDEYDGPLEVVCVAENRLLGTAGGVRNALPLLEPGPFLVLYGDVLVDEPLGPLVAAHHSSGGIATLAVHGAHDVEGKGVVTFDRTGRVTAFLEKAATAAGTAWINSGIYVIDPDLVSALPTNTPLDFGHHVFPEALRRGQPIYAYRLAAPVIDVGTPAGLEAARG